MRPDYLQHTFDEMIRRSFDTEITPLQRQCLREAFFAGAVVVLGIEHPEHLIPEIEAYNRYLQQRAAEQN